MSKSRKIITFDFYNIYISLINILLLSFFYMQVDLMILLRTDIDKTKWNYFVDDHSLGWAFHQYGFLGAKSHSSGIIDLSFAACTEEGSILGIFPLSVDTRRHKLIKKLPHSLNIFNSESEPLVKNELPFSDQNSIYREMMGYYFQLARVHHVCEGNVFTQPTANYKVNPLNKLGFTEDSRIKGTVTLDSNMWNRLEKRVRNDITYAERKGVSTRVASDDDLDILFKLHLDTHARLTEKWGWLDLPSYSIEFFSESINSFNSKHGRFLGIIGEYEGNPVAYSGFVLYKRTAYYMWGYSSDEARPPKANTFVQWAAMREMEKHGITRYDIGENAQSVYDVHGVTRGHPGFKSGFGCELETWHRGKMVLNRNMFNFRTLVGFFK
jgi:Acetyltransferase (GNAT) domain